MIQTVSEFQYLDPNVYGRFEDGRVYFYYIPRPPYDKAIRLDSIRLTDEGNKRFQNFINLLNTLLLFEPGTPN